MGWFERWWRGDDEDEEEQLTDSELAELDEAGQAEAEARGPDE